MKYNILCLKYDEITISLNNTERGIIMEVYGSDGSVWCAEKIKDGRLVGTIKKTDCTLTGTGYVDTTSLKVKTNTPKSPDITDIQILKYNKVVEVSFADGGKEKMVRHEDDKFDLRKCCFIAIAKHLYKETYTFEGIEYMAGQLMYQKKYVKIVDKALKEDAKKRLDMLRKAREEKELAKIKKNRERKRQRRLERKRQERKDFLVEAIVEAMSKTEKSDANNGKHNKKNKRK